MLEHYLLKIRQATSRPGQYAYRGQEDSRWRLHSAATRLLITESGTPIPEGPGFLGALASYHRQRLLEPARTRGFDNEGGRRLSDIEVLAKLQHYGAATGLLDFTWSPLVALWFAAKAPDTYDGTVFVVNTTDTVRMERLPSASSDSHAVDSLFSPPDAANARTFFWEPPYRTDAMLRIVRQHSVFIVDSLISLRTDDELVTDIIVDQNHKQQLIQELALLNVSSSTLFADVYGFAESNSVRAAAQQPLEPYDNLVQGNRHYQRQDYVRAIAAYTRCINAVRSICEPYFLRGNARASSGDQEGAIEDYSRAIRHKAQPLFHSRPGTPDTDNPILFMVYFNRGNVRSSLAMHDVAIDDYTMAIELATNGHRQSSLFFNRANAYAAIAKFRQALDDYDRAIQLGSAIAHYNKGNALVPLGRFKDALRSYEMAREERGDSPQLRQNRWAVATILSHTNGRQHTIERPVDGPPGPRQIRIDVAAGIEDELTTESPVLAGNAGNVGSFGGPGQPGGEGHDGTQPMVIVIRNVDRVQT